MAGADVLATRAKLIFAITNTAQWTVLGVNGQHSRTVLSRVEVEIRRDQGRVQTRRHLMKNTCAKGRPLKQQIVTPTAVQ